MHALLLALLICNPAQAAIKFVLHGNSLTAYMHSGAGKTGYSYTPLNYAPAATTEADGSAIGGSRLTFDTGESDIRGWVWPGWTNASTTSAYSVLVRVKFVTTPPTNPITMFAIGGFDGLGASPTSAVSLTYSSDGTVRLHQYNNRSQQIFGNTNIGSWSPTAGVWYDVVLTTAGTTASNSLKVYVNGTLLGQQTPGGNLADANGNFNQASIGLGFPMVSGFRGDVLINEMVVWDTVIDPTSGGLNLSGAGRSSFVSTSGLTLDPTNSTDPGAASVLTTAGAYVVNGVTITPTYVSPSTSTVKTGTAYGAASALLGTYTGADRWTCPSAGQLSTGVTLQCNSLTTNLTGTRDSVTNILQNASMTGADYAATLTAQ